MFTQIDEKGKAKMMPDSYNKSRATVMTGSPKESPKPLPEKITYGRKEKTPVVAPKYGGDSIPYTEIEDPYVPQTPMLKDDAYYEEIKIKLRKQVGAIIDTIVDGIARIHS